jgi:hypothetical protein
VKQQALSAIGILYVAGDYLREAQLTASTSRAKCDWAALAALTDDAVATARAIYAHEKEGTK